MSGACRRCGGPLVVPERASVLYCGACNAVQVLERRHDERGRERVRVVLEAAEVERPAFVADRVRPEALRALVEGLAADLGSRHGERGALWRRARRLERDGAPVRWTYLAGNAAESVAEGHLYLDYLEAERGAA